MPHLKITNIERVRATGVVSLGWQSNPGEVYRMETSTDLINWANSLGEIDATGETTTATVSGTSSNEDRRFYRVKEVGM